MPIRRSTDPLPLQHVWDAIRCANFQKQMADYNRIIKYLQRFNCTPTQAELYLKQCLDDGLVVSINKTTLKGAKLGSQVESYKIPSQEVHIVLDDYKDWYCIDCHLAGDVTSCRMCHRVFHEECANKKQYLYKKTIDSNNSWSNFTTKDTEDSIKDKLNDSIETEDVIDITNENDSFVNNNIVDNVDKQLEMMENSALKIVDPINNLLQENCQGYDLTLCSICNMCKLEPKVLLDKTELNYLLTFVHTRIKSWLPANLTDTMSMEPKPEWLTESEIVWRSKLLFYQVMNMTVIENKLKMNEYSYLVQFKADVLTIQHNVAIYHGTESQEYGAAEYMLEDCRYDLAEIINCADCYKHSNEKINNKWFCLPCRVPHKLVWAKQKGYPYWPAKVLKETATTCDVRFFGGKYERSVLPNTYIKPISTRMSDSQTRKNSSFNKAVNELTLHQKMLNNVLEAHPDTEIKNKMFKTASNSTVVKKDNSKKRKCNWNSSDDLFNKTAQALEASLSVQSVSPHAKTKRSTSPAYKEKIGKTTHRTSYQINKNKLHSTSPKNGVKETSTHVDTRFDTEEETSFENRELSNQMLENSLEEVSSSTEQIKPIEDQGSRENSNGSIMPETERQYSESVEKTRRKLEQCLDKKQLIKISLECMQAEIDRINTLHDDYIKKLFEVHSAQVSETKRKQWCYNCEQDAIYHCCWNTAYCSPTCQQQHWQAEHKKVCRRKR